MKPDRYIYNSKKEVIKDKDKIKKQFNERNKWQELKEWAKERLKEIDNVFHLTGVDRGKLLIEEKIYKDLLNKIKDLEK